MVDRSPVPNGLGGPVSGPHPVAIGPLPFCGKLLIRGGSEVAAAASRAAGLDLPQTALQSGWAGSRTALWLGPDEWLLLVPSAETESAADALRGAMSGHAYAVVDVSERFAGFVLDGSRSRDVLAAGCPVDLHPRVFGPGTAVRTLLGKVDVILWSTAGDSFTLLVGRSFADYAGRFLTNAALEHGIRDRAGEG